jgi:hypothetical protein
MYLMQHVLKAGMAHQVVQLYAVTTTCQVQVLVLPRLRLPKGVHGVCLP